MHNLLFCAHKLCMNYVTNTLLLVSSSVRSKQLLCSVHRQGQKSEQKHITKKFVGFHNHSRLLTMILRWYCCSKMYLVPKRIVAGFGGRAEKTQKPATKPRSRA